MDIGRLFRSNPFADDDGAVQPAMAAALDLQDPGKRQKALVVALVSGRVFVPVRPHAHPGDSDGETAEHEAHNPDQVALTEAGELTVPAPGDLRAMPVFSSAESLAQFDPAARPVPLLGRNAAAQSLLHTGLLALDCHDFFGRSAVLAIASGESWLTPWDDPQVRESLERSLVGCEAAQAVRLLAGPGGVMRIAVVISDFVGRKGAEEAVTRVATAMASDTYLKSHLDLVEIVPVRRA